MSSLLQSCRDANASDVALPSCDIDPAARPGPITLLLDRHQVRPGSLVGKAVRSIEEAGNIRRVRIGAIPRDDRRAATNERIRNRVANVYRDSGDRLHRASH